MYLFICTQDGGNKRPTEQCMFEIAIETLYAKIGNDFCYSLNTIIFFGCLTLSIVDFINCILHEVPKPHVNKSDELTGHRYVLTILFNVKASLTSWLSEAKDCDVSLRLVEKVIFVFTTSQQSFFLKMQLCCNSLFIVIWKKLVPLYTDRVLVWFLKQRVRIFSISIILQIEVSRQTELYFFSYKI